jgi:molecular chaperone GrpE
MNQVKTNTPADETQEAMQEQAAAPVVAAEDDPIVLKQKLEEEKTKAAEYLDQWRRTAADFANFRKRTEKEQAEFGKYANSVLIARLLPILDDFERAVKTVPDNLMMLSWVEGIFLIERKLRAILEAEGLKPIEAVDKPFDPTYHEAILREESTQHEDGQVMAELQKGYMLHDRVLRPTMVKVAKQPSAKQADNK